MHVSFSCTCTDFLYHKLSTSSMAGLQPTLSSRATLSYSGHPHHSSRPDLSRPLSLQPPYAAMQSHFAKLQWPASNMASSVAQHLSAPTISYVQRLPRTSPYSRISCMARTVAPGNHARPPHARADSSLELLAPVASPAAMFLLHTRCRATH